MQSSDRRAYVCADHGEDVAFAAPLDFELLGEHTTAVRDDDILCFVLEDTAIVAAFYNDLREVPMVLCRQQLMLVKIPFGLSSTARRFNIGSNLICGRMQYFDGLCWAYSASYWPPPQASLEKTSLPSSPSDVYQAVRLAISEGVALAYTSRSMPITRKISVVR